MVRITEPFNLFFLTEQAIYISSYALNDSPAQTLILPYKSKKLIQSRLYNVESGSSSASSAQDQSTTKLPVLKPKLANRRRDPLAEQSQQCWAIRPAVVRKTALKKSKYIRKSNKRSGSRRKSKPIIKLLNSDGDSVKSSSSLPSSETLPEVKSDVYPTGVKFKFEKPRLDVLDTPVLLSAEDEWSSSRRTPTVRTRRGDAMRRVNSNLNNLLKQDLLS